MSTQPGVRRESASTLAMSEPVEARKPAWRAKGRPLRDSSTRRDAGIAESYLACAVGAGVVDDDDLGEVLEAACLMEDGFETGAEIGLFVVRRDDEAEQHAVTVAKLCVNTLNFADVNLVGYT